MAQTVKNSPVMEETWVRSLNREDPLEKGLATHSNIPAWRIPWTEDFLELWVIFAFVMTYSNAQSVP